MPDNSSKPWVIYTLHDPRTPSEIRYVGVTHQKTYRRRKHHIGEARRGSNKTHSARWIRRLLHDGVKPELTVIEEGSGDTWGQAETKWISYYRNLGAKLTNLTGGGEGGFTGGKHTQAALAKMGNAARERWQDPKYRAQTIASIRETLSDTDYKERFKATAREVQNRPEVKAKQREAQTKRWAEPANREKRLQTFREATSTPEAKAKVSTALKAVWADPETREKRRAALRAGWAKKRQAAS